VSQRPPSTLALAGFGMVGHRFLSAAVDQGLHETHRLVVFGEEPHLAYDRVHLSSYFDHVPAEELLLAQPSWYDAHGIEVHRSERVVSIDAGASKIICASGAVHGYDHLVLATGSYPFVPPIAGTDAGGVFVYRTIDDLVAIEAHTSGARRGIVIGGGLLGLEAANALRLAGVETHVIEMAPRLMPMQLDEGGARQLRREIEALGVTVHCATGVTALATRDGHAVGVDLADGSRLDADMIVFSVGIRPRDELAREAGLEMGVRGGVVIDDSCLTSHETISAIGEVACHRERVYGLVAPGYRMAEVVAARLAGDHAATFTGATLDTKLKLIGVEVASFGDAHGSTDGADEIVFADPPAGRYKKLVLHDGRLIGGVLVGDTSSFSVLTEMARGVIRTPKDVASLVAPASGGGPSLRPTDLPGAATICSCHNVTKGTIEAAIADEELADVGAVKTCTKAGTGCGSCVPVLKELLVDSLRRAGKTVTNDLCEHFSYSRQELFDLVRVQGIRTFGDLVAAHGRGRGCEICKPAVASILASLGEGYILDGEQGTLQDTNDTFLANMQRDGTYSVVPRVPGGEITPAQLIALGEVARDFGLYSKITGGQRIDLFGARVDELPQIWARLIDAGFESGHAYGKALRTVKSCVGSTWCRYGVQDSVNLAIRLELRYRGLRAPHKIKMAVSGCARECAEAQGKDVGIIATERGYNLYLAGNGGMRPQHGVLFATDLDEATLVTMIDRFLILYIRTADRLQRTASWFNALDGGLEHLRSVIVDDTLGLAADLDAAMAHHVETYECEWKATLADSARLARFESHVSVVGPPSEAGDWQPVTLLERLPVDRGVTALVDGREIAVFRLADGGVWAIDNLDPFSDASVLSRGVVGDRDGEPKVASPMFKQSFSLRTGACLDDEGVAVDSIPVRIVDGVVEIAP
jgi:nitrite reductase (NADH) large subunit